MIRSSLVTTLLAGLTVASGCRLEPDFERPGYPVPEAFDGVAPSGPDERSFGDLQWFEVFDDPVLQELIERTLENNYDVRLAAERVLQARSIAKIARADLFPDVQAGGSYRYFRVTEQGEVPVPPGVDPEQEQWDLFGDLFWEIDFWGRIRSASDAARADLFATEFARQAVIQTLVCDVALAYLELLELDAELEITRRTLVSRKKSFELVSLRLDEGVANKVEYRQAESLVLQTAGLIPDLEQNIQLQENQIRVLTGDNPGPVPRGRPLLEQSRDLSVPVGLPSDLLTRRPDVSAAEQNLVAANARIGEARALLYPSIRLTALGGVASEDLSDLFSNGSDVWDIAPSVRLPIFNAGRLRANVAATESFQRQATLQYLQSLQIAFREVADALISREKSEEVRAWREQLEFALRDQVELSNDRYLGGVTSYLEVLDSQRDHFDAEIDLARSIRNQLFSYVLLYRALGGGWQGTEELAASGAQEGASATRPAGDA